MESDDAAFEKGSTECRGVVLRFEKATSGFEFVDFDLVGECERILLEGFVYGVFVAINNNLACPRVSLSSSHQNPTNPYQP